MRLKELCHTTNVEYDSKRADRILKKIRQQYLIGQNGNKKDYYIIRELTEEEKYNVKKLTNCKQILSDTILSCIGGNPIRSDTKGLLELFNIVNNKYKYFLYEQMNPIKYDILKDYIDPKSKGIELYYFVSDIHPILSRMLKDALKSLENKSLIYIKEYLMFGYYERFTNSDGDIVETRKGVEANREQIREFMKWSKYYMDKYNYSSWNNVPYFKKIEINRLICKKMKISYVYNEYELILNKECLVDENKDLKNELNNAVIEKLKRSKQGKLKDMEFENKKDNIELLIKKPHSC